MVDTCPIYFIQTHDESLTSSLVRNLSNSSSLITSSPCLRNVVTLIISKIKSKNSIILINEALMGASPQLAYRLNLRNNLKLIPGRLCQLKLWFRSPLHFGTSNG